MISSLTGLGGLGVTFMLLVFGVAAVAGAMLGGRASDRAGPGRTLAASLVVSLALNASFLYIGGAAGSALGGLVLARAGIP